VDSFVSFDAADAAAVAAAADSADAGWRAELSLTFTSSPPRGTYLRARKHRGPLVVQRAFYPEGTDVPHVYILHPPGGIVGGDRLRLDVKVESQAHALLTTPAATKIYRTAGPVSALSQTLTVDDGGALEWLPMENILFDRGSIDLATEIHLAPNARFIGTDMLCFGLPARGERFSQGRCRQRFDVWRAGRPLLIERARFDGGANVHDAAWGLGGADIVALLVATPIACTDDQLNDWRATFPPATREERMGVTLLRDTDVLLARYVGNNPEHARTFMQRTWAWLRPMLLEKPAIAPRIWAT